jgi:hypothetical protein
VNQYDFKPHGAITQQSESSQQPAEMHELEKEILNHCWNGIKKAKTAWGRELTTKTAISDYLIGLGKAFALGRVDSMEKLNYGLKAVYLDDSPWLPSAGQFVKWCNDGYRAQLKINQQDEAMNRIRDERRLLSSVPFAEQQSHAKIEISGLRAILKKNSH